MTSTSYYRVILAKPNELTFGYDVWAFNETHAVEKADELLANDDYYPYDFEVDSIEKR